MITGGRDVNSASPCPSHFPSPQLFRVASVSDFLHSERCVGVPRVVAWHDHGHFWGPRGGPLSLHQLEGRVAHLVRPVLENSPGGGLGRCLQIQEDVCQSGGTRQMFQTRNIYVWIHVVYSCFRRKLSIFPVFQVCWDKVISCTFFSVLFPLHVCLCPALLLVLLGG